MELIRSLLLPSNMNDTDDTAHGASQRDLQLSIQGAWGHSSYKGAIPKVSLNKYRPLHSSDLTVGVSTDTVYREQIFLSSLR